MMYRANLWAVFNAVTTIHCTHRRRRTRRRESKRCAKWFLPTWRVEIMQLDARREWSMTTVCATIYRRWGVQTARFDRDRLSHGGWTDYRADLHRTSTARRVTRLWFRSTRILRGVGGQCGSGDFGPSGKARWLIILDGGVQKNARYKISFFFF